MVFKKLLQRLFSYPNSGAKITVSGFKKEQHVFQKSVEEEAQVFLGHAEKLLHDIEGLNVHAKISGKGNTAKYELHSLLSLPKTTIHAKAAGRKLNLVLDDLFEELLTEARKHKSKADRGKRGKFQLEVE